MSQKLQAGTGPFQPKACPIDYTIEDIWTVLVGDSKAICGDSLDPFSWNCPTNKCCPVGPGGGGGAGPGGGNCGAGDGNGGGPKPGGPIKSSGRGTGGGGGGCGPGGTPAGPMCCDEAGMPGWVVSEPAINLWLRDTPMWYQPSRGRYVSFELSFKNFQGANGSIDNGETNIFSVGANWHTPWRSYITPYQGTGGTTEKLLVFLGDGTVHHMRLGVVDYESSSVLNQDGTNYVLTYLNGDQNVYGTMYTDGTITNYFLARMQDANSNALTFQYTSTNSTVYLSSITDVDNRQITFQYTNTANYAALISKVIGPFGLTNTITYDTNGQLTSITDVVNLQSSMQYDTNNYVRNVITPYGTNRFDFYLLGSGSWKALRVTELGQRQHLYVQGDGPTGVLPNALADYSDMLTALVEAGFSTETFDTNNLHQHNSYYWGPMQYPNLSSSIRSSLDSTNFDIANLTTNDYNVGRLRHWLQKNAATPFMGMTMALQRQPSDKADGSTEGLTIWYDHANKPSGHREFEGDNMMPTFAAWKVYNPDWDTLFWRIDYYERNQYGLLTKRVDNYGDPWGDPSWNALPWRTNTYQFAANDLDVVKILQTEHDSMGNLIDSMVSSNAYNALHQVVTNFNALGEMTTFLYDSSARLVSVTRPNGLTTTNLYDGNGYLVTTIDKGGSTSLRTNSFTYTNGLVWTSTDERGLTITRNYDALGRQTSLIYPDGTGITNMFDKLDVVQATDRLGKSYQYTYNGFGQITKEVDPLNRTNTWQYCNCGSLDSATDPLGNTTSYLYDNRAERTKVTYPDGSWVTFNYNQLGQLTNQTDSAGASVTNRFNIQGQLIKADGGQGRLFHTELDIHNRVATNHDQNAVLTVSTYDALDRLLARTVVGTEKFFYNANISGPTNYTDPLGNTTIYIYDLFGRKTNEVHTGIDTNKFTYSPAGDLLTLTDGKGQTTTWKYDQYGRVTNKLDAASTELFRYSYDASGRLTNRWSTAKGTTKYSYDAVGNLTLVDYPASSDITLAYDADNRLTNMVDAAGTTVYGYTAAGLLQSEDGPWANDTVTYAYNNRLRGSLTLQQPSASPWNQSYTYDSASRLSALSSPAGAFSYIYRYSVDNDYVAQTTPVTADSVIARISLPSGAYVTNTYDAYARLTGTYLENSGNSTFNSHAYTYNNGSQRTRQTRTDASYVDYTYDSIGQLKTAIGKEPGGTTNRWHEQFGYAYDPAGNLNWRTNDKLKQAFNVNSLNQLTTTTNTGKLTVAGTTTSPATNVTVNGSTADRYADNTFSRTNLTLTNGNNAFTAVAKDSLGRQDTQSITINLPATNSFTYDSNGNLTYDGNRAFDYDDENQLTRVTVTNNWKSEFTYDGKMRRRIRKEFVWQNSAWSLSNEVRYVYDGNLVIQERDGNNVPVVSYTRGQDLSGSLQGAGGIGGLLAFSQLSTISPQHFYYHADGNGNVTMLMSTQQLAVAKYIYDPFGNLLSLSGQLADANLYRFSSKEAHLGSGLVYYLYRFYDPNLQKWPNRDPLGESGFEVLRVGRPDLLADDPNLYAYVKNNPANQIDALGLDGEATIAGEPTLLMDEEALAAYRAKQCRCAAYAAAVQAAKAAAGALGGCKSGDTCAVLAAKNTAWLTLAIARSRLNKVCFGGGDAGHQKATADAWSNVGKCGQLLGSSGCTRF